ncbi:MAG: pentapeptide repeat-containing protein [Anaerolineales bacterium]|nr:pentapeptide repeat-containing protein [Anaerolineales bacterium]
MSTLSSSQSHQDEKFENITLEAGETLTGEFVECAFSNCFFSGVLLKHCRFNSCIFTNCDLSLADISGSAFPSTRFEKAKLIGINWTSADWGALGIGTPPVFLECVLNHGTFIGVDLKGTQILDCVAREVDFREADLSGVKFGRTDFSGSLFGQTNLSKADLSRAYSYAIDPGANTLEGTRFSMPEALSLLYNMNIVLDERLDLER